MFGNHDWSWLNSFYSRCSQVVSHWLLQSFFVRPEVMALDNFLNANGVWTLRPTLSPDCRSASRRLNPLNCFSGYLLRLEESTKCVSWIFTRASKMIPNWQKSLSAVEIDNSDRWEPNSSGGGGGDRCRFSSMRIRLMPLYWRWIQKPRSENESIFHQRQRRLCWRRPYRQKSLSLSHKRAFLLASVSHLLTPLLIRVGDLRDQQPRFLWTQRSLCPAGEREIELKNVIFKLWNFFRIAEFEFDFFYFYFFLTLKLFIKTPPGTTAVQTMCIIWTCPNSIMQNSAPTGLKKIIAMWINVWKTERIKIKMLVVHLSLPNWAKQKQGLTKKQI